MTRIEIFYEFITNEWVGLHIYVRFMDVLRIYNCLKIRYVQCEHEYELKITFNKFYVYFQLFSYKS